MLTLLSAPLALLAALVVIVMVVAVRGGLAFLREVEHEAHHRNVEVVELNGDFLQIALHSYVTARYNAAFGELGATGYAARCTMESFTGDSLLEACSDFSATLLKDSATLLTMSESCFAAGFHLLWVCVRGCNRVVYVPIFNWRVESTKKW